MPEAVGKILLVGAGGHARAVAEVVKAAGVFTIAGLIDSFQLPGSQCIGYSVLGSEQDIPLLCVDLHIRTLFVAIGDNYQRAAMVARIRNAVPDVRLATLIHPSAVIGGDVKIGEGTVIMPGAVVVANSKIGEGCVLNTSCSLDHDGIMEDWSSLGPGAVAGGNVSLGARSFVGLGTRIIHRIAIGADTVIGAGSLVLRDIPSSVLAYGSPCLVARGRAIDEGFL